MRKAAACSRLSVSIIAILGAMAAQGQERARIAVDGVRKGAQRNAAIRWLFHLGFPFLLFWLSFGVACFQAAECHLIRFKKWRLPLYVYVR
ncbi:MAG TPA: hypothetical protein VGD24_09310, partial [Gallionella sp.]